MPLEYYKNFKNHPAGQWIMSESDCQRLQKLVKDYGCKTILDLGSGIGASTYALAEATEGKVWAVEQWDKCQNIAKEIMPEELRNKIIYLRSNAGVMKFREIAFHCFSEFKERPKEEWDLVVIDGPGPFMFNSDLIKLPNGDIFDIFHSLKSGCIIYIDSRLTTVLLMKRYLFPYLKEIEKENTGSKNDYHIFQRNEVPFVGFIDTELSILKANGYFNEQ